MSSRKQPVEIIYRSLCEVTLTRRQRKRKDACVRWQNAFTWNYRHILCPRCVRKIATKGALVPLKKTRKNTRAINSSGYGRPFRRAHSRESCSIYWKRVHAENRRQTTGLLRKLLDIRFLKWRTVGKTLWARKHRNPKRNLSISIGVRLAAARSLSFVYRCITLSAVWSRYLTSYHCFSTKLNCRLVY